MPNAPSPRVPKVAHRVAEVTKGARLVAGDGRGLGASADDLDLHTCVGDGGHVVRTHRRHCVSRVDAVVHKGRRGPAVIAGSAATEEVRWLQGYYHTRVRRRHQSNYKHAAESARFPSFVATRAGRWTCFRC